MKITSVISNLQKYLKHSTLIQVKDSLTRYALHDITPLATLACHDIGDLQTTVKFCNESNIDYVVKAGGTNQSNSSIRQNCLVLDLSFLKQISHTFDQKSMKINIQAGVTFGHLQEYLKAFNKSKSVGYTVPFTWYRGISVIGAHSIMGNGLLHRKCGVGVDLIKQAKVMVSNGDILIANESTNSDLLWGIKGCGPNFGAILEVTEQLPDQSCNIMDPKADLEIRIHSYSTEINEKNSKIGNHLRLIFQNTIENTFPYVMFIMSKKTSTAFFLFYENLYDKTLKRIKYQKQLEVESIVKDMVHVYNGKNNLKHEFIITKNADTGIKYDESKRIYYKLWGGSTTLQLIPSIIEELTLFHVNNPITQFQDEKISLNVYLTLLDSPIFQRREAESTSWPNSRKESVFVYCNIAFSKKQLQPQIAQYLKKFECTLNKHLVFGSACDLNPGYIHKNQAEWVYGHNYEKIKRLRQKYDPINKFGNGLF